MYPMRMDTDSSEVSSVTGKAAEFSKKHILYSVNVFLSLGYVYSKVPNTLSYDLELSPLHRNKIKMNTILKNNLQVIKVLNIKINRTVLFLT